MTTFKLPEPVAWRTHPFDYGIGHKGVYAKTSELTLVASWERKGWKVEPLYTAQALKDVLEQAEQEPIELLATDDFYSWWEENPSLGQQQALVQFYDKQPAPQQKPLSNEQISTIQRSEPAFRTNSCVAFARAIEAAHNIGVKP